VFNVDGLACKFPEATPSTDASPIENGDGYNPGHNGQEYHSCNKQLICVLILYNCQIYFVDLHYFPLVYSDEKLFEFVMHLHREDFLD
jgi:hypothetical protein